MHVFSSSGGIFEFEAKSKRLLEIDKQLEDPAIWDQREKMQLLGRERASLLQVIENVQRPEQKLMDAKVLLELAQEDNDETVLKDVAWFPDSLRLADAAIISGRDGC